MPNSIEANQVEQTEMIVPAGIPVVYVNGKLCDLLSVTKIVRGTYPEFSWAELLYNPALLKLDQYIEPEDLENVVPMGSSVKIYQLYNNKVGAAACSMYLLFAGHTESINTEITDKTIKVIFKARDISAKLDRVMVKGKRIETSEGNIYLANEELIFNPNNQPNRSKDLITHNGLSYHVFRIDSSDTYRFSYAQAINYIISEHVLYGMVSPPDMKLLEVITYNALLCDFDVDGLSVLDALNKLCSYIGINFVFVPNQNEHSPDISIVFYIPGSGRVVELNRQYSGDTFNISRTNIHKLSGKRSIWPVTYRFTGTGEKKEFEATFNLVKAWDPSKEGFEYDNYSTSSESFVFVQDVYRKWCLNESGDYTGLPYNQGPAYDFKNVFETESYIRRKRKFYDCFSADSNGDSLGAYLEISYDNGFTWTKFDGNFKVLHDECGVWISSAGFENDYWIAAQSNNLKFRITAVVQSDEHLSFTIADGPINSSAPVIDRIVKLPMKYYYRKVSNKSIFYTKVLSESGIADEADDTLSLVNYVRHHANASKNIIEEVTVTTPIISAIYEPGDKVTTSPDSRDILGIRKDSRSLFWIDRVEIDYEKQHTKLKVLRQRKCRL